MADFEPLNRRAALRCMGAVVAVPVALSMGTSAAQAGLTRKDVNYQLTPHGAQRCGLCASFIMGKSADADGTCKIVAGPIPPNGWCALFAKR